MSRQEWSDYDPLPPRERRAIRATAGCAAFLAGISAIWGLVSIIDLLT